MPPSGEASVPCFWPQYLPATSLLSRRQCRKPDNSRREKVQSAAPAPVGSCWPRLVRVTPPRAPPQDRKLEGATSNYVHYYGGGGEGTHERQDGTPHPRVRGGGVIEPRARHGGGETAASQPAEGDASAPFAVLAWRGGGTLVLACAGPGPMTCRFTGTNSKPRPDRRNGKITEDCRASHAKTQAPERSSHRMLHDAATAGPQQPDTAPQKKTSRHVARGDLYTSRGEVKGEAERGEGETSAGSNQGRDLGSLPSKSCTNQTGSHGTTSQGTLAGWRPDRSGPTSGQEKARAGGGGKGRNSTRTWLVGSSSNWGIKQVTEEVGAKLRDDRDEAVGGKGRLPDMSAQPQPLQTGQAKPPSTPQQPPGTTASAYQTRRPRKNRKRRPPPARASGGDYRSRSPHHNHRNCQEDGRPAPQLTSPAQGA